MREYSEEFKANIIARMLPPNNVGVPQLAQETGISKNTLLPGVSSIANSKVVPQPHR